MILYKINRNYIRNGKFFFYLVLSILIAINVTWVLTRQSLADFGSFVASARAAEKGFNPYGIQDPLVFRIDFPSLGLMSYFPNMNPPISVMFFNVLTLADPYLELKVWRLISLILYILTIGLLAHFYQGGLISEKIFWALSLAGFWHTLELGQIYIPLLLACAGAFILIEYKKFSYAGILIGIIIALKPNFIVWPLFLLFINCWQAMVSAILSAGFLSIIPIIFYGPKIYIEWFTALSQFNGVTFPGNNSLVGLTARFGIPWFGYLLGILFLGTLLLWLWRTRYSAKYTSALAIVVSLLISPISWTGYTILLLPLFFSRKWGLLLATSAIILSMPFLFVLFLFQLSSINFVVFGWLYGWALILILIVLISEKISFHPLVKTTKRNI